ncbi:MAG: hypothetical protein MUF51_11280 [Vicinamibacteria bacterium]|nr:hypothetical protein [Vicinamibacteria bacterium]
MNSTRRARQILHIDLDSFFVSVERGQNPVLRGRPLIIGSHGACGIVAAVSAEARECGVRPGQSMAKAQSLCPAGVIRPGDFEAYAHMSAHLTAILLLHSKKVERPSVDEAYIDLTTTASSSRSASQIVENLRAEIQERLGLSASFGLASTRLAARIASRWARPRGFLLLLPDHEQAFLGKQSVEALPDLAQRVVLTLAANGISTLAQLAEADETVMASIVGRSHATTLRHLAMGQDDSEIASIAPPTFVREEHRLREPACDSLSLNAILDTLVERVCLALRPFELSTGHLVIEVMSARGSKRQEQRFPLSVGDERTLAPLARRLAEPLLHPPAVIQQIAITADQLGRHSPQYPLFPELSEAVHGS